MTGANGCNDWNLKTVVEGLRVAPGDGGDEELTCIRWWWGCGGWIPWSSYTHPFSFADFESLWVRVLVVV
ncbi:hypothetical protein Hanom_Chr16g01418881 [Helianthus anomalus]